MSDEIQQVYVVSYDAGDPRKSLIMPGATIRSGGSKSFASLPAPRKILESIKGVRITKTALSDAKNFNPPHPKAKYYAEVEASHAK